MHLRTLPLTFVLAASAVAVAAGCSSSPQTPGPGAGGLAGGGSGGGSGSSSGATSSGSSGSSSGASGSGSGGSSGGGSGSSSGASSSGSSSGGTGGMTLTGTLADGTAITADATVPAGQTVTIAPGAKITVSKGVSITVDGTLTASSATTHASLTGTGWTGVVVASGGTLSLDGVDITGATTALDVQKGSKAAEYDDGTITGAKSPFTVEVGGALGTKHAKVTGTLGSSQVGGSLTASFLDYDKSTFEGIMTIDPTAQLSVEDSTLHGAGPSGDMLVAQGGAAKFHVAYTEITNVHCAFHFDTLSEFDLSYLNIHGNAYGFMLYGSGGAGPLSVSYSNIDTNTAYAYDTVGTNGPITFDHDYVSGMTTSGGVVTVSNASAAAVTGVGPR